MEKEIHKILCDFEIQADILIPSNRPYIPKVDKNRRSCWIKNLAIEVDLSGKIKENKKKENT